MKFLFVGGPKDGEILNIVYFGRYVVVPVADGRLERYEYKEYRSGKLSTTILLHTESDTLDVTEEHINTSFERCNRSFN